METQTYEFTHTITYKYTKELVPKRVDTVIEEEENLDLTDVIVMMHEDNDDSKFEHTFAVKEVE